jgi:hypothetical protein
MPELQMSNQEEWIDVATLSGSSAITKEGFAVLYWNYDSDLNEKHDETLRYKLRVALRGVGHKITKVITTYDSDNETVVAIGFITTITKDEWDEANRLYNEWVDETHENEDVSDDESESESSESTDPI